MQKEEIFSYFFDTISLTDAEYAENSVIPAPLRDNFFILGNLFLARTLAAYQETIKQKKPRRIAPRQSYYNLIIPFQALWLFQVEQTHYCAAITGTLSRYCVTLSILLLSSK